MKYLLSVCAVMFCFMFAKADTDSDAKAALAIANANAKRMAELEKDVLDLKVAVKNLQGKKEMVAEPQMQTTRLVQGNVPGVVGYHMVPADSPFAMQPQQQQMFTQPETNRLRQFQFRTPLITGGVCVGPNCPGR